MALKGDTSNLLLADIFQTLSQNGQSGLLTLRGPDVERHVLFAADGVTPFDASIYRAPRLGHLLAAGRVVEQAMIDAVLLEIDRLGPDPFSSLRLLATLDDKGILPLKDGVRVLRSEVREELFEVFTLERMEFEFNDDEVPYEGIPKQCFFRTEEVVMEAARRLDEWNLINKTLGRTDDYFVVDPAAEAPGKEDILKLLDGQHTITDISERLLTSRFEVSRTVWNLLESNHLRPAKADELLQAAVGLDPIRDRQKASRLAQRALKQIAPDDARMDVVADVLVKVESNEIAIDVLVTRAKALLAADDPENAYAHVLRARELDANDVRVLRILAELHRLRGETDSEVSVLTVLAERSANEEEYKDAVKYAARIAEISPDSPLLDQAFVVYCQRAETHDFGAEVLSNAAGKRPNLTRRTLLYQGILLLDPSRGDVKRALARQQRSTRRSRSVWLIGGSLLIPVVALVAFYTLGRIGEERLGGLIESAGQLLQKGEAELAKSALENILTQSPDGAQRVQVERLLMQARDELAGIERDEKALREQQTREELSGIQEFIESGAFTLALRKLNGVSEILAEDDADAKKMIESRRKVLQRQIEEEFRSLQSLATRFEIPNLDEDLIAIRDQFAVPFAPEREQEYADLSAEIEPLQDSTDEAWREYYKTIQPMVSTALASLEKVRPGLEEINFRISRNRELSLLSEDYAAIEQAEMQGDFATAVAGLERILREYGDGVLTSFFEERLQAANRVLAMQQEVGDLIDRGEFQAANERARQAQREIGEYDIATTVGLPVHVETLPPGAKIAIDGVEIGSSPLAYWVKGNANSVLVAEKSGFDSLEIAITAETEPSLMLELERLGSFAVDLKTPVDVTPTAVDGNLFIGARDGVVYRFDLNGGRVDSQYRSGSLTGIAAPPIPFGSMVIVTLGEGELHGVDRRTMTRKWRLSLGDRLVGPPTLVAQRLYAATSRGSIYEVDPRTGQKRLIASVEGPLRSGPAVINDVVAVGNTAGRVIAISRSSGAKIFTSPTGATPVIGLAAAQRHFIAADDAGNLWALDSSGNRQWDFQANAASAAPSVHDGWVVFAGGQTVTVLDAATGDVRFQAETPDWVSGTPTMAGGRLYVGDKSGAMSAFDFSTRELVFRHRFDAPITASPILLPEGVLIVSETGEMTLIGA